MGTQTKQDRQDLIEKVLIYCNRDKIRVTYKAIADLLDVRPQSMGKLLGEMRPEASWIVNQKTKRPTGYPDQLMHKDLFKNPRVISDQADLECELRKAAIL